LACVLNDSRGLLDMQVHLLDWGIHAYCIMISTSVVLPLRWG